ncbi:MAG: hydrogenase maturation peptidase HycI [Chloroflexi bacterium]|nr:hydrogenase maturation peptidase HycI [Chloroflexota bacterium]
MMISASTSKQMWQTLLPAGIKSPVKRTVLLGIGNELNGDDAAGVQFVRLLKDNIQENMPATPAVLMIEGATAPENFTGTLRKFQPELVVMIDAALMGLQPGEMALINPDETEGITASTHTFPLSMLASFIKEEMGCRVWLIGIQPEANDQFTPLSPVVCAAVNDLAEQFIHHIDTLK